MNKHDIVPTHLVVKAMRDNGYKNAAYAIAELMDNSIQAGATCVELLCGEQEERLTQRVRNRINKIAVLDNGSGMNVDVLRMALQFGNGTRLEDFSGIGRFGMGLPNSSISQARRVDVWSWQNGHENAIHTYIDIDEIEKGDLNEVPPPSPKPIPQIWLDIGSSFEESGTLVVWSNMDRLIWRTAKAIIDNSELIIGRMYRYFLHSNQVEIRFISFNIDTKEQTDEQRLARPNDPIYLMDKTSCPEPFDNTAMFRQWGENTPFDIRFNDEIHTVNVIFSYAKEESREKPSPGSQPYGKHAKKNVGVSIVRAGRELDLDMSWSDPSEPRDRWWGVEISFPPALDDLFGVTNNKQSARNFSVLAKVDLEELLDEGQTIGELKDEMNADEDPRLPLIEIAQHIRNNISKIRAVIKQQTSSSSQRIRKYIPQVEEKGTQVTRKRIEDGYEGQSDIQEKELQPQQREKEIVEVLINQGTTETVAKELAAQTVGRGLKYTIVDASLNSPAFFDVDPRGGSIIITLNISHPAYDKLVEILRQDTDDIDENELRDRLSRAKEGLELLLMAWARYEDEQPDGKRRQAAQEARWYWGSMGRDFLEGDD